ncbi:cupin domain-containing protein [Acidobacteria bacterium AH-259-G07]|nr:cupin domain-containing protein [Acidobacteria bacterium AH-259-G07]
MEVRKITKVVQFSSEKMQKINLFESPRMFCDIYCLEPGQKQKVHSHEGNDKIYYVVQGEGRFTIGQEMRLLKSGEITCAFSGELHGVENTSNARLTCLVFMAPHASWKDSTKGTDEVPTLHTRTDY